jgi:hypothetical protein
LVSVVVTFAVFQPIEIAKLLAVHLHSFTRHKFELNVAHSIAKSLENNVFMPNYFQ